MERLPPRQSGEQADDVPAGIGELEITEPPGPVADFLKECGTSATHLLGRLVHVGHLNEQEASLGWGLMLSF